jgi:hypothetical protein
MCLTKAAITRDPHRRRLVAFDKNWRSAFPIKDLERSNSSSFAWFGL